MGTAVKGMFNEVNLKLLTIIDFIRCLQIPPRHTLFLRLMIGYQVDSKLHVTCFELFTIEVALI